MKEQNVPMIDGIIERTLFASRWLLAPFFLGLVLSLLILLAKFVQELIHVFPGVLAMRETEVILAILSLVDLSLTASLVLMVAFAGYENFVSKIEVEGHAERLGWMGKLDYGGLKIKLITSIIAISGIHLLRAFMNTANTTDRDLFWLLAIHATFVLSGVMLALMDRLTAGAAALKK